MRSTWFQFFGLLALIAGVMTAYNQLASAAYFDFPRSIVDSSGSSFDTTPDTVDPWGQVLTPNLEVAGTRDSNFSGAMDESDVALGGSTSRDPALARSTLVWTRISVCGPDAAAGQPVEGNARRVFFVDSLRGVVVCAMPGNAGRYETHLRTTTDGGQTWRRRTTDKEPLGVFFVDRFTGVAVGAEGAIFRTTDGGNTWRSQSSQVTAWLHDVFLTTALAGVAVGDDGTILRTTNGGATWRRAQSSATDHLYGVAFSDENNGVAVGYSGTVLHTADGGATWEKTESGTSHVLMSVAFADRVSGVAVGARGITLRTTDGGRYWRIAQIPTPDLFSVCFIGQTGVTVGWDVFGTTDMGEQWRRQTPQGLLDMLHLSHASCSRDGTIAVAGVAGVMYITRVVP